jgi:hypothetical protein
MAEIEEKTEEQAEEKLIGEVDQVQIDKWKAKPGCLGVAGIIVGGHIAYVERPNRNVVSYALSQMSFSMTPSNDSLEQAKIEMSLGKMYKQGEAVLVQCWLGGSEEIRTNNKLWTGACMKAGELIEYEEAELKNF